MELDTADIIKMFERSDIEILNRAGGVEGLAEMFKTNLVDGISKGEAESHYHDRIELYGINKLPDPPVKSWCRFYIETFKDITLKIIFAALIISFVFVFVVHYEHLEFTEFIDTLSIVFALMLVSTVTAHTNYQQQQAYLEINNVKNTFPVTVIRAGERQQILSTQVMVGDILEFKAGDAVAADCVFINGTNLTINNSAMTGEPIGVKVNNKEPFLRGGGAIENGIGTALVAAVGPNSQYGVTMTTITNLGAQEEVTPLQRKLNKLALQLLYIAVGAAVVTFLTTMTLWTITLVKAIKTKTLKRTIWQDLLNRIMTVITIFLCCVPEGLPLAVTLCLSFSMKKMMHDQNFVRHLSACETMGGATTICSDKTGTLTQNRMTVVKFWMDGVEQDGHPDLIEEVKEKLAESIAVNSTASHTLKEGTDEVVFVGSSSECALLKMISDLGKDYMEIRELNPILYLNEFNSARKRMSTVVSSENGCHVFFKGAPDFSLPLVSHYLANDGSVKVADQAFKNDVLAKVNDFASQAYRTMLIAYREIVGEENPQWSDPNFVESGLTMICLVGIQDPLRPEVPRAIQLCKEAGVVVRMVTGDFIATARAISKQCGIISSDTDIVMEGAEFASLSKTQLLDKIDNLRVLARSSPTDKYRLVSLLMECGEVVAVTGDGSNDSAALKKANVGFAMGMCGTELAKVASDIVILDDNFSSIVSALKWGRGIYDNLRCFLTFQIPVNFVAVACAIVGSVYIGDSPLKPIQVLWMNLIDDSLGALALATRPPADFLLKRCPYGSNDSIVSNYVARNIIVQSLYQICMLFLILFGHESIFGVVDNSPKFYNTSSWIFNTFVYMNVFYLVPARRASNDGSVWEGFYKNWYFHFILIALALVQIPIVLWFGRAFYTTKPSSKEWLVTIAMSIGAFCCGFLTNSWHLPDHTLENLNTFKRMRKEQVRAYYSGMTHEQQWDDKNAMKDFDDEQKPTKASKPQIEEDLIP